MHFCNPARQTFKFWLPIFQKLQSKIIHLEEPLDAPHLLDDLGELGVLLEELLHLALRHAGPEGNPKSWEGDR